VTHVGFHPSRITARLKRFSGLLDGVGYAVISGLQIQSAER
jgi:hypothetical protein